MKSDISSASRVALRVLLRSAAKFDRQPVLKALICRHPDVHPHLPANLDSAIATFLGGELRTHYLPPGAGRTDSLRAAVLAMYRSPPLGCDDVDTPLACMRYLDSLLRIGRKHSLMSMAGAGDAEADSEQGTAFTFTRAAMLVCGCDYVVRRRLACTNAWHSTSLGAYALCLNKPLPVKAGALVLGTPLTRALVGELFPWPQSEQESSRQRVQRWQAMYQVHRADPELGLGEQIEAADALDVHPYTRLRLLLNEKGWFEEAAAAAAAAERAQQEVSSSTDSSSAGGHIRQPAASSSTPRQGWHSNPQPTHGTSESAGGPPDEMAASEAGSSRAAAPQATTSASANTQTTTPEHPASLAKVHTAGNGQGAKEQRAAQRRAEADSGWDTLLLRFAESSLSKGGPRPSLQVLHRAAALGGHPVLPPSQADSSDGLFLGSPLDRLEELDPMLAADMHFFVGDAMWQPDQLETESARGCWIAVSPPPALRDPQGFRRGLGDLWTDALQAMGGEYAQLPRINKAVVDDVKALEL